MEGQPRHQAAVAPPPPPPPPPPLVELQLVALPQAATGRSKGCEPRGQAQCASLTSSFKGCAGGERATSRRARALLRSRSATRAAFATADIRRTLARLAQSQELGQQQQQQQQQRRQGQGQRHRLVSTDSWPLRHFELATDDTPHGPTSAPACAVLGRRAEKTFRFWRSRAAAAAAAPAHPRPQSCLPAVGAASKREGAKGESDAVQQPVGRPEGGERERIIKTLISNSGGGELAPRHSNRDLEISEPSGQRELPSERATDAAGAVATSEHASRLPVTQEAAYANRASQQEEARHREEPTRELLGEAQRANQQRPACPLGQNMSTQSFVPEAHHQQQQQQQQEQSDHYQQQQQQQLDLDGRERAPMSAHPIGLGCFSSGAMGDPVPGASDGSIVMTSSASLSPDESFATTPSDEQRGAQRHHPQQQQQQHQQRRATGLLGAESLDGIPVAATAAAGRTLLSKLVGRKASRFRELVLQNLGKADRTQDELFDLYELNFYKQQQQAQRLTKEFKLYSSALKSYHEASKSLSKCIQQTTTDYQSARHDLVCENLAHLEQLNEDLMEKLQEQVMRSVGEYLAKFEQTKEKIGKRHRKLIDYDSSRRLYELMLAQVNKKRSKLQQLGTPQVGQQQQQQQQQQQAHGAHSAQGQQQQQPQNYQSILRGLKFLSQQQQPAAAAASNQQLQESIASQLVDEARLLKLREQFNYCKLMYEKINSELHEELPVVYEKKMKSLLQALQNYYAIKAHYHSNAGKLLNVVSEVIEECPQSINAVLGIRQKAQRHSSSSPSSSSTNYDEDDDDEGDAELDEVEEDDEVEVGREDEDRNLYRHQSQSSEGADSVKARSLHTSGGGGGGGSSGVGSSREDSVVDSASSPSGSSAAGSPECPERVSHAGKADGPADATSGEQQCVQVSSQSAGEPTIGSGTPSDADVVATTTSTGDIKEQDEQQQQQQQKLDAGEQAVPINQAHEQPDAAGCPTLEPRDLVMYGETDGAIGEEKPQQQQQPPGDAVDDDVKIKILDTAGPAGTKCAYSDEKSIGAASGEQRALLYKVKTNYKYLAEDVDELCFEADEIIQVIEFDENHEPEDGWLLGIREVNNQRGLFPANFTQPI